MNKVLFVVLALQSAQALAVVDTTSAAYRGGQVAAYIFMAVFVFLVVRRFLRRK